MNGIYMSITYILYPGDKDRIKPKKLKKLKTRVNIISTLTLINTIVDYMPWQRNVIFLIFVP